MIKYIFDLRQFKVVGVEYIDRQLERDG